MPLVKQQYLVCAKREDHAVAGLSMGGTESLLVGLNHLDDFGYVGGFSSGPLEQSGYAASFLGITAPISASHRCQAATTLDRLRN
jgi:enterochelin esterase-like enzyme